VFRVFEVLLLCPIETFRTGVGGEICSFGEDEQPHWIVGGFGEFVETVR